MYAAGGKILNAHFMSCVMLTSSRILGRVTQKRTPFKINSGLILGFRSCTGRNLPLQQQLGQQPQPTDETTVAAVSMIDDTILRMPLALQARLSPYFHSTILKVSNEFFSSISSTVISMTTVVAAVTTAAAYSWRRNEFLSGWNDGLYLISTLKRRRKMMNKHKLRKRRKKNRMKNK